MAYSSLYWLSVVMIVLGFLLLIGGVIASAVNGSSSWLPWILFGIAVLFLLVGLLLWIFNREPAVSNMIELPAYNPCKPVCQPACVNEIQPPTVAFTVTPPPITFEFTPRPMALEQFKPSQQYTMVAVPSTNGGTVTTTSAPAQVSPTTVTTVTTGVPVSSTSGVVSTNQRMAMFQPPNNPI
jgi:hypothetical protein